MRFLDYYLLCERHNNVSASVNQNVKLIIKALVKSLKKNLGEKLTKSYGQISTDYEYIVAGLDYLSKYAKQKNREVQLVFEKDIDVKIKYYTKNVHVLITLVDGDDGIHGDFSYEGKKPEINIQLSMFDIESNEKLYKFVGIIRNLQNYLAHELMHCYQYLSKSNFIEKEHTLASEKIPNSFSFIKYYLESNEAESVMISAYTQFKRQKRNNVSYLKCLLRIIDFAISPIKNELDNNNLNPIYLDKKYKEAKDLDDAFILRCFLGFLLPKSRFYSLCSTDEDYLQYVSKLNVDNLKQRKHLIDKIYDLLEEKFLDEAYSYIPQAFYLIADKESLNKLCTSNQYAKSVYDRILNADFTDSDNVYDEEEDTVVHGRPDMD